MTPFVTGAALQEYCRNEVTGDLAYFTARAVAASRAVNAWCGRDFTAVVADPATVTRSYRRSRNDERVVLIHDLADPTGAVVVEDGTTLTADLIQWEPVNGIDWVGRSVPRTRLRRLGRPWAADGDEALITVASDQWGWAAVPEEVEEATLIIGKDLAHLRDNRFGVAGYDSELGLVRIRDNPYVEHLLADLQHPNKKMRAGAWVLS